MRNIIIFTPAMIAFYIDIIAIVVRMDWSNTTLLFALGNTLIGLSAAWAGTNTFRLRHKAVYSYHKI